MAAVPFLPILFDKPVEEATEWVFHQAFEKFGGPDAVRHTTKSNGIAPAKEKEL